MVYSGSYNMEYNITYKGNIRLWYNRVKEIRQGCKWTSKWDCWKFIWSTQIGDRRTIRQVSRLDFTTL